MRQAIDPRRRRASSRLAASFIASFFAAFTGIAPESKAQQGRLVWSDEFEGTLEDFEKNWSFQLGNGCPELCGWGNNEAQIYTDKVGKAAGNFYLEDGNAVLVARRDGRGGFTSARVRTANKQEFRYGRFEIRATVPSTPGVWPAIWMLPTESAYGRWPLSGEIDIMESADTADKVQGTCHFGSAWPEQQSNGGEINGDFDEGFHVFAVEWTRDKITWFLDGRRYHTARSDQWYSDGSPGNRTAPFDQDFHFLLNIAVGGNFVEQDPNSGNWPQEMRVDYVRVYELEPR